MNKAKLELIKTELQWSFAKASGPGGQHVNTTDSKAVLHWLFIKSPLLSERQIKLIQKNLKNYLNKSLDTLKLSCSQHRQKERNRSECLKRLFYLLEHKAFFEPKKRKATKPTKASVKKRLESKKRKGEIKKNRQKLKY